MLGRTAYRYLRIRTGRVHLGMPGIGGFVDSEGSALPGWLGEFLRDRARKDVLSKLRYSRAKECHAFVIVTLGGVPWFVESYLTGELDHLPNQAPDLPSPIASAWVVSLFGRRGLLWDGDSWKLFDARGEGIDDC